MYDAVHLFARALDELDRSQVTHDADQNYSNSVQKRIKYLAWRALKEMSI